MRKRASFWWRSKLCPTHNVPSSNVMSIWGMNIILIWGENWPYHHIVSPTKCYEASERDQSSSREQNCSLLGPHNIPRLKWGTSKVQAPKRRNSVKHKADREGASLNLHHQKDETFSVFSPIWMEHTYKCTCKLTRAHQLAHRGQFCDHFHFCSLKCAKWSITGSP